MNEPQHLRALRQANEIRLARAELKRQIRKGIADVVDVFRDPPDFVASARVSEIIEAMDRWGPRRTTKFLGEQAINYNRTLGTLTERQRIALADAMRERKEKGERRRDGGSRREA